MRGEGSKRVEETKTEEGKEVVIRKKKKEGEGMRKERERRW